MLLEDSIEELTKILIKEDIKSKSSKEEYLTISKTNLIKFCIKLLKEIKKY